MCICLLSANFCFYEMNKIPVNWETCIWKVLYDFTANKEPKPEKHKKQPNFSLALVSCLKGQCLQRTVNTKPLEASAVKINETFKKQNKTL